MMADDRLNQPKPHPLEAEAWRSDFPVLPPKIQNDFRSIRAPIVEILKRLDHEIPRLQAQLDRLQRERDHCRTRLEKIDSAAAPHKQLPAELLSKIFIECRDEVCCEVPRTHARGCPECVCVYWRQVSAGTTALWRKVNVDFKDGAKADRVTRLAHEIFPRGMQVLGVSARFTDLDVGAAHIRRLLSPFSSQVQRFHIDGNPLLLLQLCSEPLPSFDALDLISFAASPPDTGPAGAYTPRSLLTADGAKVMSIMKNVPALPWARLGVLSVSSFNISVPVAQIILSSCTILVDCTLTLVCDPTNSPGHTDPIILNHLRSLRIASVRADRSPVASFLRPLILPSLSHLELVHPPYELDENGRRLPSVVQLLERSQCKLESFVLPHTVLRDGELDSLVHTLSPTVRNLVLTQTAFPDAMVQRIGSGAILPKLHHIECRIESTLVGLTHFLEMLERRWEVGSQSSESRIHTATFRCLGVVLTGKQVRKMLEKFHATVDQFEHQGRVIVFNIL